MKYEVERLAIYRSIHCLVDYKWELKGFPIIETVDCESVEKVQAALIEYLKLETFNATIESIVINSNEFIYFDGERDNFRLTYKAIEEF